MLYKQPRTPTWSGEPPTNALIQNVTTPICGDEFYFTVQQDFFTVQQDFLNGNE